MVCAPQPTHVAAYCASRRSLKPGGDLRTPICSWRCFRSARQLAQRLGVSPFIRGGGGRRCCRRGMCSSLLYVYSGLPLSSKRLLLLGPSLAIGGFSVDLALFAPFLDTQLPCSSVDSAGSVVPNRRRCCRNCAMRRSAA